MLLRLRWQGRRSKRRTGEDDGDEGGGEVSAGERAATRSVARAAVARGPASATMISHLRKHRREAVPGPRRERA